MSDNDNPVLAAILFLTILGIFTFQLVSWAVAVTLLESNWTCTQWVTRGDVGNRYDKCHQYTRKLPTHSKKEG